MLDALMECRGSRPVMVRCPRCGGVFEWHGSIESICACCAENVFEDEIIGVDMAKKKGGKKGGKGC